MTDCHNKLFNACFGDLFIGDLFTVVTFEKNCIYVPASIGKPATCVESHHLVLNLHGVRSVVLGEDQRCSRECPIIIMYLKIPDKHKPKSGNLYSVHNY